MDEVQEEFNGIRLNYAVLDNRCPPLLMLHGVTRRWQTFLPLMQCLALRWKVHALDFRGHGLSGRVPGRYTVADYVPDVTEFVKARCQEPVVLYGHSLGAMVAAAAASQLESRVSAVILEDPPMESMGSAIHGNILQSFFSGLHRFAGDQREVALIASELAELRLHDPQKDQTLRFGDLRDPASLRFGAASLKSVDPEVFDAIVSGRWLDGLDFEQIFRQVTCPVLLLQADPVCGGMLSDSDADRIADWANDVTLLRFPGTGHVIHLAQTQQLVNHLHGFLESGLLKGSIS